MIILFWTVWPQIILALFAAFAGFAVAIGMP